MVLNINVNPNIILLSKIMSLFSIQLALNKGKSFYIKVEDYEIEQYDTINVTDELKNYNILEKACIYGIDDLKHLSLFQLNRTKYNLHENYYYNWEYNASFSPIWINRIREYKGYVDYIKQKVVFHEEPDDILMQEFYRKYGYEPDEQSKVIQEKSIMKIEKLHDWKWFYNSYKNNGIFKVEDKELEILNILYL